MTGTREENPFTSAREYHEREWLVQRVGWIAMGAFIVAALLGLFGDGPLSDRTIGEANVATLSFQRFARYASSVQIELTIASPAPDGAISIEVNESYLIDFEIESIVPEPARVETNDDRLRFVFDAGAMPATIKFDVVPARIGRKFAVFEVAGRELRFEQFIYP
jgi:hypothetical protein